MAITTRTATRRSTALGGWRSRLAALPERPGQLRLDRRRPGRRDALHQRLARIATELLRDIDANTVDFEPNYDESPQPSVLPSRSDLLVNGSTGIAVYGDDCRTPPRRDDRRGSHAMIRRG
jgi:hypothetical protein